ncbi:MAG: NCS2 family permease [Clostridia bacterium]|nr:NCS2 family permease [Clostridia bacterium]
MIKGIKKFCYNYFMILKNNSNMRTEILAGITNYFTLIYAVMLVPEILIDAFPGAMGSNGEIIKDAVIYGNINAGQMLVTLTAIAFIAAGISSIFIGLFVNLPLVQGPSIAIGTFVTYTICRGYGYSYNQAIALVFLSGVLFFILSVTGMEERLHKAIPNNLKYAVTAGIGFFIASTGLAKAHIINFDGSSGFADIFGFDMSNAANISAVLTLVMVFLIAIMIKKHVHGAIFIGKVLCIIAAIPLGLVHVGESFGFEYSADISALALKLDFNGLIDFTSKGTFFKTTVDILVIVFSLCIMDIFETVSTIIAMDNYINISGEGAKKGKSIPRILEVDAITTSAGSLIGSTSVSTYVESTTGIIEGGRTGLTAVVTGVLFIVTTPFAPLVSLVPSAATATTLIAAGVLMMEVLKFIDFEDITEAVPAFLTIILMPFTNSLLVGVSVGVISYVLIHIFVEHNKKISPLLYILGFFMLMTFVLIPR